VVRRYIRHGSLFRGESTKAWRSGRCFKVVADTRAVESSFWPPCRGAACAAQLAVAMLSVPMARPTRPSVMPPEICPHNSPQRCRRRGGVAVVQPDRVGDDLGRKTIAVEGRRRHGTGGHRPDPTRRQASICQCPPWHVRLPEPEVARLRTRLTRTRTRTQRMKRSGRPAS
jgi:hypothetical protein